MDKSEILLKETDDFLVTMKRITKKDFNDYLSKGYYMDKDLMVDKSAIVFIEDGLDMFRAIKAYNYLGFFKEKDFHLSNGTLKKGETHYRDYSKTIEEQKNIMPYININPDPEMSWFSALRALGYKAYSSKSNAYKTKDKITKGAFVMIYLEEKNPANNE